MRIISVDGGTTNTRMTLMQDHEIRQTVKFRLGAADQDGTETVNPYIKPLREGLAELLGRENLKESDIDAILFSGMICSETGFFFVPHITAPADAHAVAAQTEVRLFPEIGEIPLYFVPGLKTEGETVAETDIMRGEETELFGIYEELGLQDFVAVMPGSHTKIAHMGKGGVLDSFRTALTGELIRATAEHTILRTGLLNVFPGQLDEEWLERGYEVCETLGMSQALFQVRIHQKFAGITPEQLFAFHCGVCLNGDIHAIVGAANGAPVYVGGSDPFRSAYVTLLRKKGEVEAEELPTQLADHASAYGAEALMKIILHSGN